MVQIHHHPLFVIPKQQRILENYPFEKLESPVLLVERFEAYDGEFLSFDIFFCHEGEVF